MDGGMTSRKQSLADLLSTQSAQASGVRKWGQVVHTPRRAAVNRRRPGGCSSNGVFDEWELGRRELVLDVLGDDLGDRRFEAIELVVLLGILLLGRV